MPNEPLPDDILNVWQNQPLENQPMPLEEIHRRARQFEKRIQNRNLREYLGGAFALAIFTFDIFKFPTPVARTGCVLIIAGTLYVMFQIYKRAAPGRLPADSALTASLEFHRRELVRQRDLLRSVWLWYIAPVVPGLVVFVAGIMPRNAAGSVWNAVPLLLMLLILGLILWANHRAAERLDRKIAELDNLESYS